MPKGSGASFFGHEAMNKELMQRQACVAQALVRNGWQQRPDSRQDGVTKDYMTAVGRKTAIVNFFLVGSETNPDPKIWICGTYQSEGRNVLESSNAYVRPSTPLEEIPEMVERFLASVEKAIAETYAMRLYRLGVRPRPALGCESV